MITLLNKGVLIERSDNNKVFILYYHITTVSRYINYLDIYTNINDPFRIDDLSGILFEQLITKLNTLK
jgi:hypothetical protein